jgi:hypothetical protein
MDIGINIDVINQSTGVVKISSGKFYSAKKAKGCQKRFQKMISRIILKVVNIEVTT